jgi:hypothetical protein
MVTMFGSSVIGLLRVRLLVFAVIASVVSACGVAQTHSGFPVDIVAGPSPQPVMSDGRIHLLYELRLTNFARLSIELKAIEIFGEGPTVSSRERKALTIQPRRCRSDAVIARILSELSEFSFSPSYSFFRCTEFRRGTTQNIALVSFIALVS